MSLIIDDRAFLAALPEAFKELELIGHEEQKSTAERIRDAAKHYAPVLTGELRDSIEVTEGIEDGKPYFEVGTTLEYANYTEWGDTREAPHHFMLPAIAQET